MNKESLKTGVPLFEDISSLNVSSINFDLSRLIEKMKRNHMWSNEEPDSMILLNCQDTQVVLIALHAGTGMKSFQSAHLVTIQIMAGKLRYESPKEAVILEKGQLLTIHEKINYSLSANEETVFLLTIANDAFQYIEN